MPPFALAILAGLLGNLGSDAARATIESRIRGTLGRRGLAPDRTRTTAPRQVAPRREVITPPVGYGPPVGRPTDFPLDAVAIARRLTARR